MISFVEEEEAIEQNIISCSFAKKERPKRKNTFFKEQKRTPTPPVDRLKTEWI